MFSNEMYILIYITFYIWVFFFFFCGFHCTESRILGKVFYQRTFARGFHRKCSTGIPSLLFGRSIQTSFARRLFDLVKRNRQSHWRQGKPQPYTTDCIPGKCICIIYLHPFLSNNLGNWSLRATSKIPKNQTVWTMEKYNLIRISYMFG